VNILCVCPVYGHPPHLIETAIECFNRQTYPLANRRLVILDDLGTLQEIKPIKFNGVDIVSVGRRVESLPLKYNLMTELGQAGWDYAIAVWEVDDIYLPDYLTQHAISLEKNGWSHPREVWSTYTGYPVKEGASGRFHAALAFRRDALRDIGGWPETKRADFDQQLIGKLRQSFKQGYPDLVGSEPAYPGSLMRSNPQYIFRWADTGVPHGQGTMRSPDDETWYDRYTPSYTAPITKLDPKLDPAAQKAWDAILGAT
jgi:hypothetical protein